MLAQRQVVGIAADHGRDLKLIVALLDTIVRLIAERGEAVLAPPNAEHSNRVMRPEIRAHIVAVIDSFSDDEAAAFLGIGARQVRRRAQQGRLHFFAVGGKRRYGTWQFREWYGALPGLSEVIPSIPRDWSAEQVDSFMTASEIGGGVRGATSTPRTWLTTGGDPSKVAELLRSTEADHG